MRRHLLVAVCVLAGLSWARAGQAATLTVNAGGDLQAALNAAQPGDTILLQPGAVWTGQYKLPAKGGSLDITVRSAAADSSLPPAGTRITPAYASLLPKIRANSNGPALRTVAGATHWRLLFLEFYPQSGTTTSDLVQLGSAGSSQNTLSAVPQHLIVDRCYIHGDSTYGQRRGIGLNSGDTRIINSYFSNIKGKNQDTQAIAGWNGPGPYLIDNNYLEAAGENLMFGGSDPYIPNLVPSNITISHNLISRPMAWLTQGWTVKNLIELKNAANVVIRGNIIENHWVAGQQGSAIVFTPRNQGGTASWSVVRDILFEHNIVRHVSSVFNISGYDDLATSQQTRNITVRNNLFWDVDKKYTTSSGSAPARFILVGNGPKNLTFDHNTVDNNGSSTIFIYAGKAPTGTKIYGFTLTNNLLRRNSYAIYGDTVGEGNVALSYYTPNAMVLDNTFANAPAKSYPTGNFFPTLTQWLSYFVNPSSGNYQLVSGNPWTGAGTDGKTLGVDFTALNAALAGVAPATTTTTTTTTSTSTTTAETSSPYGGTAVALPGRIQVENYDAGGSGVAYFDTTSGNSGGVYRSNSVDIQATTDTGGGYSVGWVKATEWLKYAVNVTTAGTYALDMRVASNGSGGTFHVEVDGVNVTGTMTVPNTGGWQRWTTLTKTGVTLAAGPHVVRIAMDANGATGGIGNFNWMAATSTSSTSSTTSTSTTTAETASPYGGTAVALPGRIQAENYDAGGSGVAYFDTTSGNSGGVYRSNSVDIQATTDTGGGYNVGWVKATEWLKYAVNVTTAGTYALDMRVASNGSGGTFHIEVDGVNVTGTMTVPNTGGWQAWKTLTKTGVALKAGQHVVRIAMDANGATGSVGNINWIAVR